jgi:tetratricopeptide (TPR) repeat protein
MAKGGTVNLTALGKRIRKLRVERGMSQEEVATPAFTAAYMSHVEHGKRRPSHEALSHIAERLEVTVEQLLSGRDPHEDLRLEIEIQAAFADIHRGDAAGARERLKGAGERASQVNHQRALIRAEEGLALASYKLGDVDTALGIYKRASESAANASPEERTPVVVGWARCLFQNGDTSEALHLLEGLLQALRAVDPPDPTSLLQVYAALIPPYCESGLINKAMNVATEGWKLAPRVGDPEGMACLYVNRAGLLLTQGDTREAMASLALAEDQFRQLGWHSDIVKVGIIRALVLIEREEYPAAERLLTDLLSDHAEAVSLTNQGEAMTHLSRVFRLQGRPKEGLEIVSKVMKETGTALPAVTAYATREAGLCALALRDTDLALRHWRKALKLFHDLGNKEDIAKTAHLIGDQLLKAGDDKKAAAAYKEGLAAMGELR